MALDFVEIKDAGDVNRKIVGKYDGSSQFQMGVHLLGKSRSDTYTTAADGTAIDVSDVPHGHFSLQVVQTGSVTSYTVVLEVSLDGTVYQPILTITEADGDGVIAFTGPAGPYTSRFFRSSCSAITLGGGTNVVATIQGAP